MRRRRGPEQGILATFRRMRIIVLASGADARDAVRYWRRANALLPSVKNINEEPKVCRTKEK